MKIARISLIAVAIAAFLAFPMISLADEAPKAEAPAVAAEAAPKVEAPAEAPKAEAPAEAPKVEAPAEAPKVEAPAK